MIVEPKRVELKINVDAKHIKAARHHLELDDADATTANICFCDRPLAGHHAGFELFDRYGVDDLARQAAQRALTKLNSRPAPSGQVPVVIKQATGVSPNWLRISLGRAVYSRRDRPCRESYTWLSA